VLVGVTFDVAALVWLGGVGAIAGVVLLGEIIHSAIRKSLLRRFDLSARFDLTAFAAGVVGISLGTLMGAGSELGISPSIRPVHAHLNLVGAGRSHHRWHHPDIASHHGLQPAVSGREAWVVDRT